MSFFGDIQTLIHLIQKQSLYICFPYNQRPSGALYFLNLIVSSYFLISKWFDYMNRCRFHVFIKHLKETAYGKEKNDSRFCADETGRRQGYVSDMIGQFQAPQT
jgi:adenine-specific DNA methylase